jgi:hypothetical protein
MSSANRHRSIVEKGRSFIKRREESDIIDSQTEYDPDICLSHSTICQSDDFNEVWFEAEVSTAKKPSHIINKVIQAARSKCKLVFLVPAVSNKRMDYYASRIDNIIGPPSLRRGYEGENEYSLYKSSNPLKTQDGNIVLTNNSTGQWIYNEKKRILQYKTNTSSNIEIRNPSENFKIKSAKYTGHIENDKFIVDEDGSTHKYNSILDSDLNVVHRPSYPFTIPRNRIEKTINSVEYLIFGDNLTYHKMHPKIESYIDGLD